MNYLLRHLCFFLLMSVPMAYGASPTYHRAWTQCVYQELLAFMQEDAGGYSTDDKAIELFTQSFAWDEKTQSLRYQPQQPRLSFCSSAVYSLLLKSLIRWDSSSPCLSAKAWKSLLPQDIRDGETPWGYANANGVGFALLVKELGAGFSFTDWAQARPYDVIKMWWTEEVGGKERGHLALLIQDKGDRVIIWSSNQEREGEKGGYGLRSYPKARVKHVLFTRITQPAAFEKATQIGYSTWLNDALRQDIPWGECLRRLGIKGGQ